MESPLLKEPQHQSRENSEFVSAISEYWFHSPGSVIAKLQNFPKFVSREDITKFLARSEIYLKQLSIQGSIVDLGIYRGGSLMTWHHLNSIYEPVNYTREIIGFDTFQGIPELSTEDLQSDSVSAHIMERGFAPEDGMREDIERAIEIHDKTRWLSHIKKTRIIPGDITKTLPAYIEKNPYLMVSLLNIDVDIFKPTKSALELLLPRMPKGAVILFDEIGNKLFPGETAALNEVIGIANLKIERLVYAPAISYTIIS
ncbi:MAG: class I SAM-dependent methyltransferase [Magnetococcales bacterium]|nr:class I SAM-dependent methyltransferase [Magnetococcales bacterium]